MSKREGENIRKDNVWERDGEYMSKRERCAHKKENVCLRGREW